LRNTLQRKTFFEIDGLTISFTESTTPAESITGSTAAASSAEELTGNLIAATYSANKFASNCTDRPSLAENTNQMPHKEPRKKINSIT
jgi:hypothetical protein